jgi:hypothetical protein
MSWTIRMATPACGLLCAAVLSAATAGGVPSTALAAPAGSVVLAPHRAIYDLKLLRSRGSRAIGSVRGRIVYDFSGNACDGYELRFRQVSELDSGEGTPVLSDLRSTTWENEAATKFRFRSENRLDERGPDIVEGHAERGAERGAKAVNVTLSKPAKSSVTMPLGVVFPTQHMRRIIEAARAGKTVLELPVYDGSETGRKLYSTLTVIGRPIAPGEQPVQDVTVNEPALASLTRWPVTISYFEKNEKAERSSEQQPVYAISFQLYENGISRALTLDYSDFAISGEMTGLEMKADETKTVTTANGTKNTKRCR